MSVTEIKQIIKRELHQARIRKLTAVEEDGMQ